MSSPEVEKFEITDDDVYNSFNIRHGRRQTKNQSIYGMVYLNDNLDNNYNISLYHSDGSLLEE